MAAMAKGILQLVISLSLIAGLTAPNYAPGQVLVIRGAGLAIIAVALIAAAGYQLGRRRAR